MVDFHLPTRFDTSRNTTRVALDTLISATLSCEVSILGGSETNALGETLEALILQKSENSWAFHYGFVALPLMGNPSTVET